MDLGSLERCSGVHGERLRTSLPEHGVHRPPPVDLGDACRWFWIDACSASGVKVPFVQYLPGFVATLALVMINAIRRCAAHQPA